MVIMALFLSGCGGSTNRRQSEIQTSIDLSQICNFIGGIRYFPSLDFFAT
jgi:hypothetical protein